MVLLGRAVGLPHVDHDDSLSDTRAVGAATLESLARAPAISAWVYDQFRDAVRGDVLEIGSGLGNLSRLIIEDAGRLVLTDVEPRYLEALDRRWGKDPRAEIVAWNLADAPPHALTAGGRRFDTIVAINVIEHLHDDRAAIRALTALLRPGGHLLVYVPACPWAFGTLDVALGHHRRYTQAMLRELLHDAGLETATPRYINRLGLLGWLASARLWKATALPPRAVALFNRVVGLARALDVLAGPLPVGLGLVARARKPSS